MKKLIIILITLFTVGCTILHPRRAVMAITLCEAIKLAKSVEDFNIAALKFSADMEFVEDYEIYTRDYVICPYAV